VFIYVGGVGIFEMAVDTGIKWGSQRVRFKANWGEGQRMEYLLDTFLK
jgi:hypothetical protein